MLFSPIVALIFASTILQRYQSSSHSPTKPYIAHPLRLAPGPGLFQNIGNATFSSNLLVDSSGIDVMDFSISLSSITYLTGLQSSPRFILIRKILSNGSTAWQRSFGQASPDNNVYAVESDSDGNAYIAGIVGNDLNSSQGGGAFVAKFDSNGNRVWTASYGSADSKDTFYALALSSDGTKLYAVGRVGSNSYVFGNESSSRNLMRPLLAVVNTTNGELTTATPSPFSPEVDEEIRAVVVDPLNGNKAVAGGMSGTSKISSLIYGFETLDTTSGRTLGLKTRVALRNGDMRPVVAVSAVAGDDQFYAVEGCFLHRFKSDSRLGPFTELSSTRLEEQGTCLGSAMDVTVRANGNPVVVVLTALKYPMVLQYNSSDASVTPTQRVLGTTGDVSQIRSRIISGRGAPESVFLSGSNMIATRPKAFLTGLVLSNGTVDGEDIRGNQRLQRAQLIVKLATLGGTAIVLLGTLLAVFLIARHAKRSGVPA